MAKEFDEKWQAIKFGKKDRDEYPDLVNWKPSALGTLEERRETLFRLIVPLAQEASEVGLDKLPKSRKAVLDFASDNTPSILLAPQPAPSQSFVGGAMAAARSAAAGVASAVAPASLTCPESLKNIKLRFDDIAGIQPVKDQMRVNYIYPFLYRGLFPRLSKGTLLYGPPGTGKSSIAKAATGEIPDSIFFSPSPADIKGKFLGETEKNLRNLFECADKQSMELITVKVGGREEQKEVNVAIIFIDEFEAIGGERSKSEGLAASVNALLQEMDGVKARPKVSVLAATNYPWCLDAAILRRFTTRILVGLPDPIAIEFLIRQSLAKMYTPPGEGKRDKDGEVEVAEFYEGDGVFVKPSKYMDSIATYGGYKIQTESAGITSFFGGEKTEKIGYVTDGDISKIVEKLGPTEVGRKVLDEWAKGKEVSFDDPRLEEPSIFGYSPSDITKVMQYAINLASMQALEYRYNDKPFSGRKYYVSDYTKKEGRTINSLDDSHKRMALTFDLRMDHIREALEKNKSTVDSLGYFRMLHYDRWGGLPDDQVELTCG